MKHSHCWLWIRTNFNVYWPASRRKTPLEKRTMSFSEEKHTKIFLLIFFCCFLIFVSQLQESSLWSRNRNAADICFIAVLGQFTDSSFSLAYPFFLKKKHYSRQDTFTSQPSLSLFLSFSTIFSSFSFHCLAKKSFVVSLICLWLCLNSPPI